MSTYKQVRDELLGDPEVVKFMHIDDSLLPLLSKPARAAVLLLREVAAEAEAEERNKEKASVHRTSDRRE